MDLKLCICIFIYKLNCFVFGTSDEYSTETNDDVSFLLLKKGNITQPPISSEDPQAPDGDIEAEGPASEELNVPGKSGSMYSPGNLQEAEVQQYNWPEGVIFYHIDVMSYDEVIEKRIESATNTIEKASCVKFVRDYDLKKAPSSYVIFSNPDQERECVHSIKRGSDGETIVILGYDCLQERDILHSLMHLLGFRDEVTHPQRDSYVRVVWDNIQPKYRGLFTISNTALYKGEYDMLSIMHFHERAYSINGGATIVPLAPGQLIQPSDKLSLLDKMKLRMAFGHECNKRKVSNLIESCQGKPKSDQPSGTDGDNPPSGLEGDNPPSGLEGDKPSGEISTDEEIPLIGDVGNPVGGSGSEPNIPLSGNITGDIPLEGDGAGSGSGSEGQGSLSGSGSDGQVYPSGSSSNGKGSPSATGSDGQNQPSGNDPDAKPTPIVSRLDGKLPLSGNISDGLPPPSVPPGAGRSLKSKVSASGKSHNQILTNRNGIIKGNGLIKGSRTGKSLGLNKGSKLINKIKG